LQAFDDQGPCFIARFRTQLNTWIRFFRSPAKKPGFFDAIGKFAGNWWFLPLKSGSRLIGALLLHGFKR